MKVTVGSDHRGLAERKFVSGIIESLGHEVDDKGSYTTDSCDYPDIAATVTAQVISGETERGILLCGTGIGMSIAANKVTGIRAALCNDVEAASFSRKHNNANVLCLACNDFEEEQVKAMVTAWLETEFEDGRHQRRLDKVAELEKDC